DHRRSRRVQPPRLRPAGEQLYVAGRRDAGRLARHHQPRPRLLLGDCRDITKTSPVGGGRWGAPYVVPLMIDDLWYKNAVFYCLNVGTFMDANGDGVGDFGGLARRLD